MTRIKVQDIYTRLVNHLVLMAKETPEEKYHREKFIDAHKARVKLVKTWPRDARNKFTGVKSNPVIHKQRKRFK